MVQSKTLCSEHWLSLCLGDLFIFINFFMGGAETRPLVLLLVRALLVGSCMALAGTEPEPEPGGSGRRGPAALPGQGCILVIFEWHWLEEGRIKFLSAISLHVWGENTNNAKCSNPLLSEQIGVCFSELSSCTCGCKCFLAVLLTFCSVFGFRNLFPPVFLKILYLLIVALYFCFLHLSLQSLGTYFRIRYMIVKSLYF